MGFSVDWYSFPFFAIEGDASARSGSPMPSVSSEQAFLETYFLVLSQFGFDKAKELVVSKPCPKRI